MKIPAAVPMPAAQPEKPEEAKAEETQNARQLKKQHSQLRMLLRAKNKQEFYDNKRCKEAGAQDSGPFVLQWQMPQGGKYGNRNRFPER